MDLSANTNAVVTIESNMTLWSHLWLPRLVWRRFSLRSQAFSWKRMSPSTRVSWSGSLSAVIGFEQFLKECACEQVVFPCRTTNAQIIPRIMHMNTHTHLSLSLEHPLYLNTPQFHFSDRCQPLHLSLSWWPAGAECCKYSQAVLQFSPPSTHQQCIYLSTKVTQRRLGLW